MQPITRHPPSARGLRQAGAGAAVDDRDRAYLAAVLRTLAGAGALRGAVTMAALLALIARARLLLVAEELRQRLPDPPPRRT